MSKDNNSKIKVAVKIYKKKKTPQLMLWRFSIK